VQGTVYVLLMMTVVIGTEGAGVVVVTSTVEGTDAGTLVVTAGADGTGEELAGVELEADGTGEELAGVELEAGGTGEELAGAELEAELEADGTGMVVKSEASHLVQIVEIDVVYTVDVRGVVRTSVVLPFVTVWPTGQVVT